MSFSLSLKRLTEKTGDKADLVVKKVILDVFSSLVQKSPVDTGRFRGNWQIGIGSINGDTESPEDKPGNASISRAAIKINGLSTKRITYISNSLPYAQRLENGYSDQAPVGMVRLTLIETRIKLRKARI
jgi:hypothetical protein